MDVRSIMTQRPITASADATLDEVMRVMDDNDVRHVPILDGERLVGVLSDRDLLSRTGWLPESRRKDGDGLVARDLLKRKPVTCSSDDSVVMVAVDLSSRMIGCLPVIEGGKLVGIVTEMDMLDAYLDLCALDNSSMRLHEPVCEHMATEISTLAPSSTLGEAMKLEQDRGVRHLPVVDDDRLVGIVSDRDLRKAIGRGRQSSTPISEVMSPAPLALDPEEPLSRAASCLLEGRISALPVVDDGRLVGILTLVDLLDHCISNLRRPDEP
jgi:CBS domain-containing protein